MSPLAERARRTWRRSLQLRMVTITVVCSGLLVTGFGYLVAERNNEALLQGAREDAKRKIEAGADYLKAQLESWPNGEDPSTAKEVTKILISLATRPEQGDDVSVAVYFSQAPTTVGNREAFWPPTKRSEVALAIKPELRRAVESGNAASQVVTVGGNTYLVYGTPVSMPRWSYKQIELYYAISMQSEVGVSQNTQTTVILVGLMLVLLLTILVVFVTRLVAQPVRLAAQTAQRLSAGLLDQRMAVNGEDELALLADAFNQMAANLQRQIVRLEEMSRLQRRFTSDVSHELRTPLTTVRMAADLLYSEREDFDPAVARSAELLQKELDRFEELLTDLLEISRFDAGFAMLDTEPTDMIALVTRATTRFERLARRAGVELRLMAPEPPVIAEIDAKRVERALRNLVDNAIDHAEGKPVIVTLAADEHAVALTVRDHGMGLKPGEEKLVFNRFWRADPSRARQTGGTGLGLSISLEDIRLHGGWLEAWGRPGEGAVFRVTLPVRAGARLKSSPLPLQPLAAIPAQPTAPSQGVGV